MGMNVCPHQVNRETGDRLLDQAAWGEVCSSPVRNRLWQRRGDGARMLTTRLLFSLKHHICQR